MSDAETLISRARLAQGMTIEQAQKDREFMHWSSSLRSTISMTAFIYGSGGLVAGIFASLFFGF